MLKFLYMYSERNILVPTGPFLLNKNIYLSTFF